MQGQDRKAAITAYKERKSAAGIYAVRCVPAGTVWVGQSQSLDTVQNRIWFALRLGTSPCHSLQQAWREHGAEACRFEIIERLAEEESAYIRAALLKERLAHWRTALGALAI